MNEYAFIHIPKNAGQSFEKAIRDCGKIDFYGHGVLRNKLEETKNIYIIRDPVDRFTSAFFYLSRYERNKMRNYFSTPEELLQAALERDPRSLDFMRIHDNYIHQVNGVNLPTDWVFASQSLWVYRPHIIIMFDDIQEGINRLNEEVGVKIRLPHINRSHRIDFNYSLDSIRLLKLWYKDDFVMYNKYKKELLT